MGRFAVTAVFEIGAGKVPRGADVLDRVDIPGKATHRFSYCDGRTLTVVVDWTAPSRDVARDLAVIGVRVAWRTLTGMDPGEPLNVRIRSLTPPVVARVSAGTRRLRFWHPEGLPQIDVPGGLRLKHRHLDDTDDTDDIDDPDHPDHPDDGGLAGVREPRRPKPGPGHLSAALDEPGPTV